MPFSVRAPLLLASTFVALVGFISPVSTLPSPYYSPNPPRHVHRGQSIQSAIDSAKPYTQIYIEEGTFKEQLTITKDGVELIGHNTKLVPPMTFKTNTCSGLAGTNPFTNLDKQAGICIEGFKVVLAPFKSEHRKFVSVQRRVKDVRITGFTVSGFDGLDIAIIGAEGTTLCENTLIDGYTYGALTVGSKNSVIEHNAVQGNPPVAPNTYLAFIGICMDDVSTIEVAFNSIDGYNIGLCVETNGANVHDNHVTNGCIGAYVDPAIDHVKILDNVIKGTNPLCRENTTVSGAFGVWGIAVAGSTNILVKGNHISGITDGFATDKLPAAGIAVFDDFPPAFGGTGDVASGNVVEDNVIVHNDVDLSITATGSGNVEKHNVCKTSSPDGLCK